MTKPVRFPTVPPVKPHNGVGTTALVLGLVGAAVGLIPLLGVAAIVLGALALVFGLLGWSRSQKQLATNKGMAVTGTVLGAIALTLGLWNLATTTKTPPDLDRQLTHVPSSPSTT
ncbi:DUF4190 domain-containing protein [Actinophytocola xanthii]|uniref:DUF4190 domain-containing protein n=1 Tax=Actinophytocola xanthii TaxID=1912961 RepID=A0A1Q8C1Q7_9PSEU|nr:DUF4190 domain-containing protein [Actinophytocola xanthii]OLF08296.1 hypothetical protein BU204_34400 [Actinophytocola xanthii]